MKSTGTIALLIGLGVLTAPVAHTEDVAQAMANRFEPYVAKAMEELSMPGLAVGVVLDGEEVYSRAFGVTNLLTQEPVTTRSLFHMASVTKPFVATVVMQLAQEGKVDLKRPVLAYVPYFVMDDERLKDVTVAQLLNHTAGMPDVISYEWNKPQLDDEALKRYLRQQGHRKLLSDPGTKRKYSNVGFELLGGLIAEVTGLTFEQAVTERILAPLKMTDSTLIMPEADASLLTSPHVGKAEKLRVHEYFPYNRRHAPSSTLVSNVEDMTLWMLMLLNEGEWDGARILKRKTLKRMWKPLDPAHRIAGTSWFLGSRKGMATVYHGGGDTGFRSHLLLVPEASLGIVVMSNYNETRAQLIAYSAMDALIDAAILSSK